MREIDLKEIKQRQLEILIKVKEFCDLNNIDYFLDCGTLLGAVRHKGYIPWDDDIDIGMTRINFDKFVSLFNKDNNTSLRCYTYQNKKDFYFAYAKVCDINTTLYEHNQKKSKQFVNIDVFVYDSVSSDKVKVDKLFKKRERYLRLNRLKNFQDFKNNNIVKKITYIALSILPKDYFIKKLDKLSRSQKSSDRYLANIASFDNMYITLDALEPYKELEFEGIMFKVPNDTDKWLRGYFNDYMTPPPVEKRVEAHHFKAYVND